MNLITDHAISEIAELTQKIKELSEQLKERERKLQELNSQRSKLESERWWQEQSEKIDQAKKTVLSKLQDAKQWTVDQWNQISESVSQWFDEKKEQMSKAWEEFKKSVGEKFENFKVAMQQFGEKLSEMWGRAMESLDKLWDEIKISTHGMYVDTKIAMQNLCTEMYYGAVGLPIAVQKGVLAMDDAFQSVKGAVSDSMANKFNAEAGKLIVDANMLASQISELKSKELDNKFGGDVKSMEAAQSYKDERLQALRQEQEGLKNKIQSKEEWRDTFESAKINASNQKKSNATERSKLDGKSSDNNKDRMDTIKSRLEAKEKDKKSYAERVKDSRSQGAVQEITI